MQNRITQLFSNKQQNILSVYFTAGFPELNDTVTILQELEKARVNMIEIGIPFSDPLADGPTIQHSSEIALKNGMSLQVLFEQLKDIRKSVNIPLLLMGYINPVLQFGIENFCRKAAEAGIDGVVIPDLPMQEYLDQYKILFEQYNLCNIFLITPQSSNERIKWIDENSNGFIYVVSSAATTGKKQQISSAQEEYFNKIKTMNLKNPTMIGFGISDQQSFEKACEYANGVIIGSAFIKAIETNTDLKKNIELFVKKINDN